MKRALALLLLGLWLPVAQAVDEQAVNDQVANESAFTVVPRPLSIRPQAGAFALGAGTRLYASDAEARATAEFFRDWLHKTQGLDLRIRDGKPAAAGTGYVLFETMPAALAEGRERYRLQVTSAGVRIHAPPRGLFYGMQTLTQLLPAQRQAALRIAAVEIDDRPRFGYRGMHLDVGRHLFPVAFIKKYLDLMAQYKLNTFHWHLTEDQGWRIEIRKYPKLTEVGSRRRETVLGQHIDPYVGDGVPYGGYYTQEQVKDIVAYALARHITVIPEIEMPGHSLAALAAYPELACTPGPFEVGTNWGVIEDIYCPKEETFEFLEDVLTEVIALFPAPYVHIGGDEAPRDRWKESAVAQAVMKREGLKDEHALQSWFIRRIEKFLNAKGKRIIGWDEILEGGLAPDATVMSWRGEAGGIAAAKQKHDVIMSPTDCCYFDYGQGPAMSELWQRGGALTLDVVYGYDPVPEELTEEEGRYIRGVQANVWTEYLKTPEMVEYMVFPRMLALAEVAWSAPERKDYADFLRRLPEQFARLDREKVHYRIPRPEGLDNAVRIDAAPQRIELKSLVPDSEIHYTLDNGGLDGSAPDGKARRYDGPFELKPAPEQKITIKAQVVTRTGRRSGVYAATVWRRSLKPAVAFAGGKPGVHVRAHEGYFRSVDEFVDRPAAQGTMATFDPAQSKRPEGFGLVFDGYLQVPADGIYRFATRSDDGSVLWIDGEKVVDNDGPHSMQRIDGLVPLARGRHRFRLAYFNGGGSAGLQVLWGRDGQAPANLEADELRH